MPDETPRPETPPMTVCEGCGAPYDPADAAATVAMETTGRRARRPPPTATEDGDVPTHCEWCGAEYPAPEER